MVLALNLAANYDVFVTGLWGCGAFGHPAPAIMRLWKVAEGLAAHLPSRILLSIKRDVSTQRFAAELLIQAHN
jgi:hypothetical protein